MCLNPRLLRIRAIVLALMAEFPRKDYPRGVPYRPLLKALRLEHHRALQCFEKLLAGDPAPTTKLLASNVEEYLSLLKKIEGFMHGKSQRMAAEQIVKIRYHQLLTMADVRAVYTRLDACGRLYVQKEMSDLRRGLDGNDCACCPAEQVPERTYLVLARESKTLADERRRMLPFANLFYRATFKRPLSMVEHRGFTDATWTLRESIGTGRIVGSDEHSIPRGEIKSAEILGHLDRIHLASDMAWRLFSAYYFPRPEQVSDERFIAEWAKNHAGRLAAWMDRIRNFILDEVNAMLAPDLLMPFPRIHGLGLWPEDWDVKETPEMAAPLNLDEMKAEFEVLMRVALDHRGEDPMPPPPKPRRRPPPTAPPSARQMPRPIRPKPPRKKKSRDEGVRTPRRRPMAPPA